MAPGNNPTPPVQLVNEGQARHIVSPHLPVHGDGLRLDASHAARGRLRWLLSTCRGQWRSHRGKCVA